MNARTPLGNPALWAAVMQAAEQQCQCSGGICGSQHTKSGLRCDRTTEYEQLLAAPRELTLSTVAAAAVPVEQLRAWCPACHRGALAKQRAADRQRARQAAAEPLALF